MALQPINTTICFVIFTSLSTSPPQLRIVTISFLRITSECWYLHFFFVVAIQTKQVFLHNLLKRLRHLTLAGFDCFLLLHWELLRSFKAESYTDNHQKPRFIANSHGCRNTLTLTGVSFSQSIVKIQLTFDFYLTWALQSPSNSYLSLFPKVLGACNHDLNTHMNEHGRAGFTCTQFPFTRFHRTL